MSVADTNYPKIAIVVPYFGTLPSYFPLWLRSCSINPRIDWLFVTDVQIPVECPSNVKVIAQNFEQLVDRIQFVLGEDVVVPVPHKLCDYKVFYGLIFSELIAEYDYWGYCDVDVIFGKLADFLSPEILKSHHKIFGLGHLCLMPNSSDVLDVIRNAAKLPDVRKEVLLNPRTTLFDEWYGAINMNEIFVRHGLKIYEDPGVIADIFSSSPRFLRSFWDGSRKTGFVEQDPNILVWSASIGLIRYCLKGSEIHQEEALYIHLKERQMWMCVNQDDATLQVFGITPAGFIPWEEGRVPSKADFIRYEEGFWNYTKRRAKRKWRNAKYLVKMRLGKS